MKWRIKMKREMKKKNKTKSEPKQKTLRYIGLASRLMAWHVRKYEKLFLLCIFILIIPETANYCFI